MPVIPPDHRLLLSVAVLATASGLALGHYIPWKKLFHHRPHPVFNYIWGVVWVMVPASLVLADLGQSTAAMLIWLFFVAGGIAVALCYLVDNYLDARSGWQEKSEEADLLQARLEARRSDDQDDRPV